MKSAGALLFLIIAIFAVSAPASAALKPDDDPTITEGLREKGVDWLKDKAKEAGQDWLFETGQSATMHEILLKVRERADGDGNDKAGLCQGAVMGQASSILNTINYKWTVKTAGKLAFDTTVKMAGLASGFGAAAGEGSALTWLVEQYADAAKDQGKDAVFDRIKKLFGDEKKPEFELFEESGTNGQCDYTVRAVWDIVHGTYRVYIAGDCHCKEVGNVGVAPRQLGKWWIAFEGRLKLVVDKEKKTSTWVPLAPTMDFDAQCGCSKRELRKAFTAPGKQQAGTTIGTPPSTTPKGPPPLPPAGRKVCKECQKIQGEIDATTKSLAAAEGQVKELGEQLVEARARRDSANEKLAAVKANPGDYDISPQAVEKQVREAEADVKRITKAADRLVNEQIRLREQLRDLAKQLEECLKKNCADGKPAIGTPPEETPPPVKPGNSSGVSHEPDPSAAQANLSPSARDILAVHNATRAQYGAPPVMWDAELAGRAGAWAGELAGIGRLEHSPREGRGTERENIGQAPLSYSVVQVVNLWVDEQADFVPGVFPNICRSGGFCDGVLHLSQMIWPTTVAVGCGQAVGRGSLWVVCRYNPGGNKDGKMVGIRPTTVPADQDTKVEQPKLPVREVFNPGGSQARERQAPLFDLGIYAGGAWTTDWFSIDPSSGSVGDAMVLNHDYGYDSGLFVGYDLGAFRLESEAAYKKAEQAVAAAAGKAPLFDLGIYAGGAWTTDWFELTSDEIIDAPADTKVEQPGLPNAATSAKREPSNPIQCASKAASDYRSAKANNDRQGMADAKAKLAEAITQQRQTVEAAKELGEMADQPKVDALASWLKSSISWYESLTGEKAPTGFGPAGDGCTVDTAVEQPQLPTKEVFKPDPPKTLEDPM